MRPKSHRENINGANKNFSKQMDKTFLLEGRWTKSGNQYRKEVVVDSSVVQTKRESASVGVYKYYELEPIVFETDLSEEHLDGLESFAIEALIRKMQQEMTKKTEDVFGKYEKDKKVADGKFDTHIGEMPKMVDEPDAKEAKSKMFDNYGKGELGRLMTEYQYWTVKEGAGFAALATPAYLQPLWCSESDWFKAPSLKDLLSIATTILTAGAGAAITIATTAITEVGFAVMEGARTGDWISAGLEFGKKLLTSAVSSFAGGSLKEFAGSVTENIGNSFLKKLASGAITAGGNIVTGTITSAIGAVNFTNGKLGFDTDAFGNGVLGAVKGAAVSMTTTTVSGLLDNTIGKTAGMQDKITIKNANTLSSTIGGLAGQAVNYLMGEDFTLNLASFVKNKGADDEISTGLLELHLGREGAKMNLGTGGADVSMGTIAQAMSGLRDSTKIIDAKITALGKKDSDKQKVSTLNTLNMLGYTNNEFNIDLAKSIWQDKTNVEYADLGENEYGKYENGTNTLTISSALLGGGKEGSAKLAAVMAHEGTHLNGNNYEAIAHMQGNGTYNEINDIFKLQGDSTFSQQMIDGIMNPASWTANTGDTQYWKLMNDGTLVNDNKGWLVDENGRAIKNQFDQKIGADGVETGLLNILFGGTNNKKYETYSDEQIQLAQYLMSGSGMKYKEGTSGDIQSRSWAGNAEGQKLDMNVAMFSAGNSIASQVFARYYDSAVDTQMTNFKMPANLHTSVLGRYADLYKAKNDFYTKTGAFVGADTNITGEYGSYLTNSAGEISANYANFYKNYENKHFGIDISGNGANVTAGISGRVVETDRNKETQGHNVVIEYGYQFEGNMVGTGLFGEYMHLQEEYKPTSSGIVTPTTVLGKVGNSGTQSTGAHLHYDMYTLSGTNYSTAAATMFLGSNYQQTAMKSYMHKEGQIPTVANRTTFNGKTVYDPTYLYINNKAKYTVKM